MSISEPITKSTPKPTFFFAVSSLLMIVALTAVASLLASVACFYPKVDVASGAALGCPILAAAAIFQLFGTFRPSWSQAIAAANWQVGIAALLAMHLPLIPFIAARALNLQHSLLTIGLIVLLGSMAWLNLRWARELRASDWQAPTRWRFSIRELLTLTLAVGIALGSFAIGNRLLRQDGMVTIAPFPG